MTPRELAVLRDLVARKQIEKSEEDAAAAFEIDERLSLREEAGRAALAAFTEARRRSLHGRAPLPATPSAPPARSRNLAETLHELARIAAESDLAARVVAALPPLELCADNFDPVDHARGILAALTAVAA